MDAAIALPSGYALHEYRIEKLLGKGGFGLTYLATDTNLNLRVAVKEYLPADWAFRAGDHSVQPQSEDLAESFHSGRAGFIAESRTLASFRHAGIVRVMRFFEANQTAYMVMEYVEGGGLADWVKTRRPLSQEAIFSVAIPLLDGLGVIHHAGYLHRDIKPGNVYIRSDNTPVLLDFGSARQYSQNSELTAFVTPGYAPFEQYHAAGKQGPWSDLYAFGGMLYWMVTGAKPLDAISRSQSDTQQPAIQAGDKTRYSLSFLAAIDWALSPQSDARPQSVADFKSALTGGAQASSGYDTTQPVTGKPIPNAEPRTQPLATRNTEPGMTEIVAGMTQIAFDAETLKRIGSALMKHIGPVAPVVIRNAAKKSTTVAALIDTVAQEIGDEKARAAFVKKMNSDEDTVQAATSAATRQSAPADKTAVPALGAEVLQRAEKLLAQHIGVIAKIVVKRAAGKARSEEQLYQILAEEIENKADRQSFIRKSISVS